MMWLLRAAAFVGLLATASLTWASGSEQTHNTVPSANATFLSDLQNFLKEEDAKRWNDQFQSFVSSGCKHGTGAGLTGTPSACTAYPGGYYTLETASITYSDNATSWVVINKDITGNLGTFVRVSGTNYLVDNTSGTQPTLCTNCAWMMKVVTSGGAITAVTDLRVLSPLGSPVYFNAACIQLEGATVDSFKTSICVTDPTAMRTITFADMTGSIWPDSGLTGFSTNGNVLTTAGSGAPSWQPAPTQRNAVVGYILANSPTNLNTDIAINPGSARDLSYTDAWTLDTGSTLSTSLVAYWKLDGANGCHRDVKNFYDLCSPQAAPTGAAAASSARGIGSAAFASASSQFTQTPAGLSSDLQLGNISVSIAAWVYLSDNSATRDILSQFGNSNGTNQFKLEYITGTDRFRFTWYTDGAGTNVTVTDSSLGSPSINTWYFVVAYHDATNNLIGLCINALTCNTAAANGGNSNTNAWCLGCSDPAGTPTNFWNGRLDEVAVWRKVLASQERTDLYNSGTGQTLTRTYSDTTTISLTSRLVKQLSANWVVGTNAGCLDTGSSAALTWYHLWAIRRSDTAVVDVLCSLSMNNPTMPTNYDSRRLVGSIRTDGSGNILAFSQVGDTVYWSTPIRDVNAANGGTSSVARSLTVPTGREVDALLNVTYIPLTNSPTRVLLSNFGTADIAPSATAAPLATLDASIAVDQTSTSLQLRTSRGAQFRSRESISGASNTLAIVTLGWRDPRGIYDYAP